MKNSHRGNVSGGAKPFDLGGGFSVISDELVNLRFTACLKPGPSRLLISLSQKAWDSRSLYVRAAGSFAATISGISERTIDRHLAVLRARGFIRLQKLDKYAGNIYFVEPVYLWPRKWHELEGILNSRAAQWLKQCQGGFVTPPPWPTRSAILAERKREGSAKMAEQKRQNGASCSVSPGIGKRQNGAYSRLQILQRDLAQCVIDPNEDPLGGEAVPAFEEAGEQRGPIGQDQKGNEGVGLTADFYQEIHNRVHSKHFANTEVPAEERPVMG